MAGPSELTGVVPGVVPGARGGDVAGAVSGAMDSFGKMMDLMVRAQDHKKQQAAQQLDNMTRMIDAGLGPMVDVTQVPKLMKKMGIPVRKPEDLKSSNQDLQGQQPVKPSGTTSLTGQVQDGSKGVSSVNQSKGNVEKFKAAALDHWYQNAMAAAEKKGMTGQALQDYSLKVAELKSQAANGDANATGQLMKLNEIPFSIDRAVWNNASDKQKQGIIDLAAGRETEKEFNTRRDHVMDNLLTTGKFKDPDMARRAADALAKGNALPSDVKAAMAPNTFRDLADEAGLMNTLVELGVPADKLGTTAEAARVGGLQNALPTGLRPLAIQTMQQRTAQLELEGERVKLEGARVGMEAGKFAAEERHWQAMAAAADAKAKDDASKETLNTFKTLVEMKKAGISIDPAILSAASEKFANSQGVEVKEVNNFFHWLTGGTHQEFSPRADKGLASQMAGQKPKQAPEPSTFQKVKDAINRANNTDKTEPN